MKRYGEPNPRQANKADDQAEIAKLKADLRQLTDLTNVLRRPVESKAESGRPTEPVMLGGGCSAPWLTPRDYDPSVSASYCNDFYVIGGPARTRTWDQGFHCFPTFLPGVDYLITLI